MLQDKTIDYFNVVWILKVSVSHMTMKVEHKIMRKFVDGVDQLSFDPTSLKRGVTKKFKFYI